MKRSLVLAGVLIAGLSASCSSAPPSPSPQFGLEGEKKSLKALAGRWEGTFTNPTNGRTGTIVFEIFEGKEGYGDILMIPPGANAPLQPSRHGSAADTLATMPKVLQFNFIAATGNEINGTVGPFEDLQCGCDGRSELHGTVRGDSIEGTFTTEFLDRDGNPDPSKARTGGTWKVARTKKG